MYEAQIAKAQADAMKGESEPDIEAMLKSNEVGVFSPQVS